MLPLFFTRTVFAVITPLEVAVVVNADDAESKAVANEYISLRNIPPGNVIYLNLGDYTEPRVIPVDEFRKTMLSPVLEAINSRQLASQINCIAWSCGMPAEIDISEDLASEKNAALKLGKTATNVASVTGLTYLYQLVLAGDARYTGGNVNFYASRPDVKLFDEPELDEVQLGQLTEAVKLTAKGNFDTATQILNELLRAKPLSSFVRVELAVVYARSGNATRAIGVLKPLIDAGWDDAGKIFAREELAVISGDKDFMELLRKIQQGKFDGGAVRESLGFDSRFKWRSGRIAKPDEDGIRYMLSTVLSVDGPRGLSVEQAIANLSRTAKADGARPEGTIYFMQNSDIRTEVRSWAFDRAVKFLKNKGLDAKVATGKLPANRSRVAGLMAGSPVLDIESASLKISPGAICEHFTSHGGVLQSWANQTPMRDFLIVGAAGSGGTVTEPYAIADKFPSAFLHCHYASGCTLAEAFYQSITGPYQYLVAGDPLCKPYCPDITVKIINLPESASAEINILNFTASASTKNQRGFMAYIDGKAIAANQTGEFEIDISKLTAGYHKLAVAVLADDSVSSKAYCEQAFTITPKDGRSLQAASGNGARFHIDASVKIAYSAPGAASVELLHNGRAIAKLHEDSGIAEIDSKLLGTGPVAIYARAIFADGSATIAEPVPLTIER